MTLKAWMAGMAAAAIAVAVLSGCSEDPSLASSKDRQPAESNGSNGANGSGGSGAKGPSAGTLERYRDYATKNYRSASRWLCWPGADDVCSNELSVAIVNPNGVRYDTIERASDPQFDCFYVYPTISRDGGLLSDWNASADEEGVAATFQAAPLASSCRVIAPVYRQWTLESLATRLGGGSNAGSEHDPFEDVLDAWRTYMATENGGRGVVLVGHSQGSALLSELIRSEIEPNPDVAELLIAAYLPGFSVQVPDGELVGGTFASTPLCATPSDTGCVVTWSSYRASEPALPGSIFGRNEPPTVAACNPPSALDGSRSITRPLFPAQRSDSVLASLVPSVGAGDGWFGDTALEATYAALPEFITIECAQTDTHRFASVTVNADATDPRADGIQGDLGAGWGLHLLDVSLVLGDMVELVEDQYAGWAKR